MTRARRRGLAAVVWGLRLTAAGTLALWVVPTRRYEATEVSEKTYFALGWPDPCHWLASEVELVASPCLWPDGTLTHKLNHRGPLTAWDPPTRHTKMGDGHTYRRWHRQNPLFGPVWTVGVTAGCWAVARYLAQFRRPVTPTR